ncbi:MAG: hypothetical protein PHR77_15690 [Kiritimatiellae bacterium]|nr:hypothetical protein [Kiritimatiellia bacterium]MDD5519720.1 hypothetical protein [Kiritimatiellia bacterium]
MSNLKKYTRPNIFVCPGSKTKPGRMTNVDEWMDYIYIPWGTRTNIPPEYPMLYDKHLNNHGNLINMLYVDGSPGGDKNVSGLKRFAKEHPDLKIPLPKDEKRE